MVSGGGGYMGKPHYILRRKWFEQNNDITTNINQDDDNNSNDNSNDNTNKQVTDISHNTADIKFRARLVFAETMWGFIRVKMNRDVMQMEFIDDHGRMYHVANINHCVPR